MGKRSLAQSVGPALLAPLPTSKSTAPTTPPPPRPSHAHEAPVSPQQSRCKSPFPPPPLISSSSFSSLTPRSVSPSFNCACPSPPSCSATATRSPSPIPVSQTRPSPPNSPPGSPMIASPRLRVSGETRERESGARERESGARESGTKDRGSGTNQNNDETTNENNQNGEKITKRSLNFLRSPPNSPTSDTAELKQKKSNPRHSYSSSTPINPSPPHVPRIPLSPHRAASSYFTPSALPPSGSPPSPPRSPLSPPPSPPCSHRSPRSGSPFSVERTSSPPFTPTESPQRRRSSTHSSHTNSSPSSNSNSETLLLPPSLSPAASTSSPCITSSLSPPPRPSFVNRPLSPSPVPSPSPSPSPHATRSPPLSPTFSPVLSPVSTPLSPISIPLSPRSLPRCDWEKDKFHKNFIGTRRPPLLSDTFIERCSTNPWERRVQKICALITRELITNLSSFPSFPRKILGEMSELVKIFFPEKHLDSIGSVLILRVLCPLLCDPHAAGLCPTPPNATQRKALMSVMKLYQKICNSLPEKADEKYMYFETKKLRKYLSLLANGEVEDEGEEEEEEEEEWKNREQARGKGKGEEWERSERGAEGGLSNNRPLSRTRNPALSSQSRSLSYMSLSTAGASSSPSQAVPPPSPPSSSSFSASPSKPSTPRGHSSRHHFPRPTSSYIPSRSPNPAPSRSPPSPSSPPSSMSSSPPSSSSSPPSSSPVFPSPSRSASSTSPRMNSPTLGLGRTPSLSSTPPLTLPPTPPSARSQPIPNLPKQEEETKPKEEESDSSGKPKTVESILAKPNQGKLDWRLDLQSKRDASEEIITSLRRTFPKFETLVKKELKGAEELLGGVKALLFPHEVISLTPGELVLNIFECVDFQLIVTNQRFYLLEFPGGLAPAGAEESEKGGKGDFTVSWLRVLNTSFVFFDKDSLVSGVVIQYEEEKKKVEENRNGKSKVVGEGLERGGGKWMICQLDLVFREQRDAQFFCNLFVSMKQLAVLLELGETRIKKIRDLEGKLQRTSKQVDEMRLRLDYQL